VKLKVRCGVSIHGGVAGPPALSMTGKTHFGSLEAAEGPAPDVPQIYPLNKHKEGTKHGYKETQYPDPLGR
jgi:hypothetical protein